MLMHIVDYRKFTVLLKSVIYRVINSMIDKGLWQTIQLSKVMGHEDKENFREQVRLTFNIESGAQTAIVCHILFQRRHRLVKLCVPA